MTYFEVGSTIREGLVSKHRKRCLRASSANNPFLRRTAADPRLGYKGSSASTVPLSNIPVAAQSPTGPLNHLQERRERRQRKKIIIYKEITQKMEETMTRNLDITGKMLQCAMEGYCENSIRELSYNSPRCRSITYHYRTLGIQALRRRVLSKALFYGRPNLWRYSESFEA